MPRLCKECPVWCALPNKMNDVGEQLGSCRAELPKVLSFPDGHVESQVPVTSESFWCYPGQSINQSLT